MSGIELIIVFKKRVPLKLALKILTIEKVSFREGSDSSRGKAYFYKTGPKFIVEIPKKAEKIFIKKMQTKREVFEVYHPQWDFFKD